MLPNSSGSEVPQGVVFSSLQLSFLGLRRSEIGLGISIPGNAGTRDFWKLLWVILSQRYHLWVCAGVLQPMGSQRVRHNTATEQQQLLHRRRAVTAPRTGERSERESSFGGAKSSLSFPSHRESPKKPLPHFLRTPYAALQREYRKRAFWISAWCPTLYVTPCRKCNSPLVIMLVLLWPFYTQTDSGK